MEANAAIVCIAWGSMRQKVREKIDPASGRVLAVGYSPFQLFWWYDMTLQRHSRLVDDGDSEPKFHIPDNLPFRVMEAEFDRIKVSNE